MKKLYVLFCLLLLATTAYCQCPPKGNLTLYCQEDIDKFGRDYPNCTTYEGRLEITHVARNGSPITNLKGLSKLTTIKGFLILFTITTLPSFEDLKNLTTVEGTLWLQHQGGMKNLKGLENITRLDYLNLDHNPDLVDISALKNVTQISNVNIWLNPKLTNCNIESVCSLLSRTPKQYIAENAVGCNSSEEVRLSCGFAPCTGPAITDQPDNVSIGTGQNTSFSIVATADASTTYQWQVDTGTGTFSNLGNNATYSGVTSPTLSITNTTVNMDEYKFRVVVNDPYCPNPSTSSSAKLTINCPGPVITSQPANTTFLSGQKASFSVAATGTNLSYQWQINTGSGFTNLQLSGNFWDVDTPTLFIPAVHSGIKDGSQFRVVISNGTCTSISSAATLTVDYQTCPALNFNSFPQRYGDYILRSQAEVDSFIIKYPRCIDFPGNLHVADFSGSSITNLKGLRNLKTVQNGLLIYYTSSLSSLDGLQNLNSVGEGLSIANSNGLTTLNELTSIKNIAGISISDCPALTDISALDQVTKLDFVRLTDNTSLSSCAIDVICKLLAINNEQFIQNNGAKCSSVSDIETACSTKSTPCPNSLWFSSQAEVDNFIIEHPTCTTIAGHVYVQGPSITNLNGLRNLTSVGELGVFNTQLVDLKGLENLQTTGRVHLEGNDLLTTLVGLRDLTTITGPVDIYGKLKDLSGFSNVTSMGRLQLGGTELTDLSDLKKLKTITELYLNYNSLLTSLTGLEQVTSPLNGSELPLNINNNPLLTTCAISVVCQHLSTPGSVSSISNNGANCNTIPAVQSVCASGSLPVSLASFTVQKEASTTLVTWKTATEINTKFFAIEHSTTGKNWETVGEVAAKGESTTLQQYSFLHTQPMNGENFYRLRIVDNDKSVAYSRARSVIFEGLEDGEPTVYPNPAKTEIQLKVTDWSKVKQLDIYNSIGLRVYTTSQNFSNKLGISHLPEGFYVIKLLYHNGKVYSYKILKNL